MQDEGKPLSRTTASTQDTVRWRKFDRMVQAVKARHADIPAEELQSTINEACAAVRQEMWPASHTPG